MSALKRVLLMACVYVLAVSSSTNGSPLVKFNGIDGSYQGPNYEGWSEARGISGAFRENECGEIIISKYIDKASLKFIEATAMGSTFPKAEIHDLITTGAGTLELQTKIELKNATIYEVRASKSESDPLEETLEVQAEEILFSYTEYDGSGRSLGMVQTSIVCEYKAK